jgi:hypothetical protein
VRIRIFLARMFGLTAAKSVLRHHVLILRESLHHNEQSTNFCWMIGLREKRFHVLVWVAYLILTSEPAFDKIFLIKVLLMTELTNFAASFGV